MVYHYLLNDRRNIRFRSPKLLVLAADGNLRYVDFSLKPVTDEGGQALLLVPEGRDITNHKKDEERIKRQADFLQDLIDAMPYPIFYKNRVKERDLKSGFLAIWEILN